MITAGILSEREAHHHTKPDEGERDPVCGMAVHPATAKHRSEHAGHTYYFCGSRCRERFAAEPARYLKPAAPEPARPAAGQARWTCPMHPQIVRSQPGSCPICGMALDSMSPVEGEVVNPELHDMTRRFWVGFVLSIPLVALAMAGISPDSAR